jgi:23S rRNA A1618 N6-methylase RlmF
MKRYYVSRLDVPGRTLCPLPSIPSLLSYLSFIIALTQAEPGIIDRHIVAA